jgi:[NiFe] hydrogenase diaphorase moiety large subunit
MTDECFEAGQLDDLLLPIVDRYGADPGLLVQVLRTAQETWGYLPAKALTAIAKALRLPRARVEGVAGFYSFLHLAPVGRYRVLFSDNISDRMLGSVELMDRLCNRLWLERGKVSEDGLVSVDTTSCTGMCDQGPALLVNGRALTRLSAERIDHISELIRAQLPLADWPGDYFVVEDNIRRRDALLTVQWPAGEALRAAIARGAEAMLVEMRLANLRGTWRRRVHHLHQVGIGTAGDGSWRAADPLRRRQRRRGRTRHLQGSGIAQPPCRPAVRWHERGGLHDRREQGPALPAC